MHDYRLPKLNSFKIIFNIIMKSFLAVYFIIAPYPLALHAENKENMSISEAILFELLAGNTEHESVKVTVCDCETKAPLFGAKVKLDYYKVIHGGRIDYAKCGGEVEDSTDVDGKAKLKLIIEGCPHDFINFIGNGEEDLDLAVSAQGYVPRFFEVKKGSMNVCLERAPFNRVYPPVNIEYPDYEVDITRCIMLFDKIKTINSREEGQIINEDSYVARSYSFTGSGDYTFTDFLDDLKYVSSIKAYELFDTIVNNEYPLPYKSVIYKNDDSWRAEGYVYSLGRNDIAKAILNISDDRMNTLLPKSVDIHPGYLKVLYSTGITLSYDDYIDFLSQKYQATNPTWPWKKKADHLELVRAKLAQNVSPSDYPKFLIELLKNAQYPYESERLARELFNLNAKAFIQEAKDMLLQIKPINENNLSIIREYMQFLYANGEHQHLAVSIKNNPLLMKAFLAEELKDSGSWVDTEIKTDPAVKESLITKMPLVTSNLKKDIAEYLLRTTENQRWCIRNLAYVDRNKAEDLAREWYAIATNPPKNFRSDIYKAKKNILWGAAEAKISCLCDQVYKEIEPNDKLSRDYFSIGAFRIHYLYENCPYQFNKYVSSFDDSLLAKEASGKYNKPYNRDTIWKAVEMFFPKDKAVPILNKYYCSNNKLKELMYQSKMYPKYPLPCLCNMFDRDFPPPYVYSMEDLKQYLLSCFPDNNANLYEKKYVPEWAKSINDRSYEGFANITKPKKDNTTIIPFDEKYRAFFLGASTITETLKSNVIDWAHPCDPIKALNIISRAVESGNESLSRPALYAYSFYPHELTSNDINKLELHVMQLKYPEYLYAAYSIGRANPNNKCLRQACDNLLEYHFGIINNRKIERFKSDFAFNTLIILELCAIINDDHNFLTLLRHALETDSIGRYPGYKRDLERIISTYDIRLDNLIKEWIYSQRPVDVIIGIRIADLRRYSVPTNLARDLLHHDDAYVRLAIAKYILNRKDAYGDLYETMQTNTNRRVRIISGNPGNYTKDVSGY